MTKIIDYTDELSDLVSFSSNKYQPIHRWYPFVEGFGKEFIRNILFDSKQLPKTCLEPFSGVGTTALSCQEFGVRCHSFESNPFFYSVGRAKLRTDYSAEEYEKLLKKVESKLKRSVNKQNLLDIKSKTFFENDSLEKWLFDKEVAYALTDIHNSISKFEDKYQDLFKIALGRMLPKVSNVYRNGKCLSYKKNWKEQKNTKKDIYHFFLKICKTIILKDIRMIEQCPPLIDNYTYSVFGDSREKISQVSDESIDIVITSPPYLNSRDYTDVYRLELWLLGYVNNFQEERKLRKDALTSHVQIQLPDVPHPQIGLLEKFLKHLEHDETKLWNKNIPNMVKGYFYDMENMFINIRRKLKDDAKVYINVSNSSYGGKVCEVDIILVEIAKKNNFKLEEIRIARHINSSVQQNLKKKMRESVIVLKAC